MEIFPALFGFRRLKFLPMKPRTLSIASVLFALFIVAPEAWACSCLRLSPPEAEFDRVDAVFTGVITDDGQPGAIDGILNGIRSWVGLGPTPAYGSHVTLRVTHSWKGVTSNVLAVRGNNGADCGYAFRVGTEYLIYASGNVDSLDVSSCSRTSELLRAALDMRHLASVPELPLTDALSGWRSLALAAVISGLVLLVALLEWRRRQRAGDRSAP
jgi:hypothetical protein